MHSFVSARSMTLTSFYIRHTSQDFFNHVAQEGLACATFVSKRNFKMGCKEWPVWAAKFATWSLHDLMTRGGVQPQQSWGTWWRIWFFFGSKLWRVGNISGKKMLQCFDNLFTRNPPWLILHLLRIQIVYAPWRAFYEPAHQSAYQPFCIALQNVPVWYKPPVHQLQSPA